jgi:hypothetical protein
MGRKNHRRRRHKNPRLLHHETQAAHAYDNAAKKYHGEFAALNFEE